MEVSESVDSCLGGPSWLSEGLCAISEKSFFRYFSFVWFYWPRLQKLLGWPTERNSLDHHRGPQSQKAVTSQNHLSPRNQRVAVTSQSLWSPNHWRVMSASVYFSINLKKHTAYRNSNRNHEVCKISFLKNFYTEKSHKELTCWDFPGGPGAKTPCSQCRAPGFDFWSGN